MMYLGLDPGKSGGIAVMDTAYDKIHLCRLNETEADIADFLRDCCLGSTSAKAWLERVSSRPGQGVSSTFKFGTSYGFLRGLLIGMRISFETVTPGEWQRKMRCLSKGDKNTTKARAQELFPQVKVCHWNADALLLAEFGRRLENGQCNLKGGA